MRPTSAAFRAAIAGGYHVATLAEVLRDGVVTGDPLPAVGGTVTLDSRAATRGRMDLQLVDDGTLGLVPTDAESRLAPYGNELRISRGLYLPSGEVELVRLGVFRIDDVDVSESAGSLTIAAAGGDRSGRVIDARFETPYEIDAGTNVETAIVAGILPAIPDVVTDFPGVTFTTPKLIAQEGDDRWKFHQDMAAACGLSLYFDGDGILTLRPIVDGAPVATIAEADESNPNGATLLSAGRRWTRTGAFNAVIATGENTGETEPVRGVQWDNNPLSPTYYFGRFGHVPRFYQSQFIVTSAQATAAAAAMLARELGTTQSVNFGSLVDPALEPDDTVTIRRARAGIDEDHIIDSITIPLGADGVMAGQTRAQVVR